MVILGSRSRALELTVHGTLWHISILLSFVWLVLFLLIFRYSYEAQDDLEFVM